MKATPPCGEIGVLLVDDDEVFREALAENLRIDGHEVADLGAAPPRDGPVRSDRYGILITEYEVPGRNGFELADRFHGYRPRPVLLVTAHASATIERQVGARWFMRLLSKPLSYDALHRLLHDAVRDVAQATVPHTT